jgi:hypothetical protein
MKNYALRHQIGVLQRSARKRSKLPHPGFSFAIRTTNRSVSSSTLGRPRNLRNFDPSNLLAMSFRYQASSVSGLATAANSSKAFRPSRWAISANVAFSAPDNSNLPLMLAYITGTVDQEQRISGGREPDLESPNARKLRDREPSLFNAFEIFDHTGAIRIHHGLADRGKAIATV